MDFTDLTKVMLQGRRFFRPFDLETRGLRRVLHPFAGAISALGFAIAAGTFIWNDVVRDQTKETVLAEDKSEIDYTIVRKLDDLRNNADEIIFRLGQASLPDKEPYIDYESAGFVLERMMILSKIQPKGLYSPDVQATLTRDLDTISKENEKWWGTVSLPKEQQKDQEVSAIRGMESAYQDIENTYFKVFAKDKDENGAYLKSVTTVSYLLYTVGLVIGVLGQLVGIKPEGLGWEG